MACHGRVDPRVHPGGIGNVVVTCHKQRNRFLIFGQWNEAQQGHMFITEGRSVHMYFLRVRGALLTGRCKRGTAVARASPRFVAKAFPK
jgi:hypothetical protein